MTLRKPTSKRFRNQLLLEKAADTGWFPLVHSELGDSPFVFRFKSLYTGGIVVHSANHEQYTIDKTNVDNL